MNTKILIPILAVGAIVMLGGILLLSQTPEPQSTPPSAFPPPPNVVTSVPILRGSGELLAYRSEKLGVEFEYPKEFQGHRSCEPNDQDTPFNVGDVYIEVDERGVGTFLTYTQNLIDTRKADNYILNDFSQETMQIDGRNVVIINHDTDRHYAGSGSIDRKGKFVLIDNGAQVFRLDFINGISACTVSGYEVLDQLMDTWKFID